MTVRQAILKYHHEVGKFGIVLSLLEKNALCLFYDDGSLEYVQKLLQSKER